MTGRKAAFRRAGQRALRRAGRPMTVYTGTIETEFDPNTGDDVPVFDDQGDPSYAFDAGVDTVGEIRLRGGATNIPHTASGGDAEVDAVIYLLDPLLDDAGDTVEISSGGDDITEPATEIAVPDSGRYRVRHVHAEAAGRQRCACERL